jgi:hypothetical protein
MPSYADVVIMWLLIHIRVVLPRGTSLWCEYCLPDKLRWCNISRTPNSAYGYLQCMSFNTGLWAWVCRTLCVEGGWGSVLRLKSGRVLEQAVSLPLLTSVFASVTLFLPLDNHSVIHNVKGAVKHTTLRRFPIHPSRDVCVFERR